MRVLLTGMYYGFFLVCSIFVGLRRRVGYLVVTPALYEFIGIHTIVLILYISSLGTSVRNTESQVQLTYLFRSIKDSCLKVFNISLVPSTPYPLPIQITDTLFKADPASSPLTSSIFSFLMAIQSSQLFAPRKKLTLSKLLTQMFPLPN